MACNGKSSAQQSFLLRRLMDEEMWVLDTAFKLATFSSAFIKLLAWNSGERPPHRGMKGITITFLLKHNPSWNHHLFCYCNKITIDIWQNKQVVWIFIANTWHVSHAPCAKNSAAMKCWNPFPCCYKILSNKKLTMDVTYSSVWQYHYFAVTTTAQGRISGEKRCWKWRQFATDIK